ncbi:MAG: hypothetical protein ABR907_04075 [Terracidiphilus sp.]
MVGPRYIPGQPIGQQGGGWAPDTNKVPDASKITPPVAVPGTRAGHDISLELEIDAGVPIEDLSSKSRKIEVEHTGVRIVCFATDGYVGNDMEIIGEVQKHPNARVFAFGIGTSVNRFLLDGMARAGRGAVDYVTLAEKADEASKRFYERVHFLC